MSTVKKEKTKQFGAIYNYILHLKNIFASLIVSSHNQEQFLC